MGQLKVEDSISVWQIFLVNFGYLMMLFCGYLHEFYAMVHTFITGKTNVLKEAKSTRPVCLFFSFFFTFIHIHFIFPLFFHISYFFLRC